MVDIPNYGQTASILMGQSWVEIGFDGKSFPKGTINVFENVEIIENMIMLCPTLTMYVNDENNYLFNELNLHDQNKIQVTIKRLDTDDERKMEFRLFTQNNSAYSHGYQHKLVAMINNPLWTQDTSIKAYADKNSHEVISAIIGESGLREGTIEPCNDKMTWRNAGLTRSAFAKQIVDRGFKKADGLMRLGVRADGLVHYLDVFAQIQKPPVEKFVYGDIKQVPGTQVHSVKAVNAHGFVNSWASYGYKNFEPMLDGKVRQSDAIEVSMDGPYAPYNKDTYNEVGVGRYDYVPTDAGNTYDDYWHNQHNNLRKSMLFTTRVDVIVYEQCKAQLMDPVELHITDMQEGDEVSRVRGGKYLLAAKKTIMRGMHYAECLMLLRIAYNEEGEGKLQETDGKGEKGHNPIEYKGPTQDAGVSDWTYSKEKRKDATDKHGKKLDGCGPIVDEECMPTSSRSTGWDELEDFTDDNPAKNGPYKVAKTEKKGEVKKRERDTDPPT